MGPRKSADQERPSRGARRARRTSACGASLGSESEGRGPTRARARTVRPALREDGTGARAVAAAGCPMHCERRWGRTALSTRRRETPVLTAEGGAGRPPAGGETAQAPAPVGGPPREEDNAVRRPGVRQPPAPVGGHPGRKTTPAGGPGCRSQHADLVAARVGGEIKVGRLHRKSPDVAELRPQSTNPGHRTIRIDPRAEDVEIIGVAVDAIMLIGRSRERGRNIGMEM